MSGANGHQLLELLDLWDRRGEVKTFSGGMKRRLEIARGLLHRPSVLFLDEPTHGLDPQTRSLIWKYLLGLRETDGITLLMTTQYMDEAEYCDRIAIIDHGLTGHAIREQDASAIDPMRQMGRMWQRR